MMDHYNIEFLVSLPDGIDEIVRQGQKEYEASHGVVCDYKPFSIVMRSEAGEPIGVLSAYTAYAEIYIDDIWIGPGQRKRGLGRELLEALENRYKDKGYNNINLVTNQFQAVGFYQKCGYEVEFVRTNKPHPELTKTFFIKYLQNQTQVQGILEHHKRDQ